MLNIVQLKPYAKRKPHQLSGGQQQRVALARCLAKSPKLLLLDEPLGALDRKLREQTQFELVNIIKNVGVTCVLVTHDQEEAMIMADRIAVMSQGRFLQVGQPQEIYETPSCRFVADFIGDVNLFNGMVEVDEADHVVMIARVQALCRSRHHRHRRHGGEHRAASRKDLPAAADRAREEHDYNCMRGRVTDSGYFGSFSLYRVTLDDGTALKVQITHNERHGELFQRGQQIYATWRRTPWWFCELNRS